MSKSIKYKNDVYLDTSGIVHGTEPLIESGSWTPKLACVNDEDAPTVTYARQRGHYVKIGNLVYFNFSVRGQITKLNGTNNYALIAGVPFLNNILETTDGMNSTTIGIVYDAVTTETNQAMYLTSNGVRVQYNNGSYANKWKITTERYFEISASGFFMLK